MASITITIPDAVAARVVEAVAVRYHWQESSGLTKAQFAKRVLINVLLTAVKQYEADQAAQAAREAKVSQVESEIDIT